MWLLFFLYFFSSMLDFPLVWPSFVRILDSPQGLTLPPQDGLFRDAWDALCMYETELPPHSFPKNEIAMFLIPLFLLIERVPCPDFVFSGC